MNNKRRKIISKAIEQLEEMGKNRHIDYQTISDIWDTIEEVAEEEQESFNNLSEGLQETERGKDMEYAANMLYVATDRLDRLSEFAPDNSSDKAFELLFKAQVMMTAAIEV